MSAMTNIVDSYRQSHPVQPKKTNSRWSLALAGLGAIVVCGFVLLQIVASIGGGPSDSPGSLQDSTFAQTPAQLAAGPPNDTLTVGSTTKMLPATIPVPGTGWVSLVIGLATGLAVFFGLSRLLPIERTAQASASRLVKHLSDAADERRYHGGPIRD
jgi:hypothetical protein